MIAIPQTSKLLVYALCEPIARTGSNGREYSKNEVRYIGTSHFGLQRPKRHFQPSVIKRGSNRKLYSWISRLLKLGTPPKIAVIEEFQTHEHLMSGEMDYIFYFRSIGRNLLNITDGGGGCTGFKATPELREIRRKNATGKKASEEAKLKNRLAHLGKFTSKETREKRRKLMLGNKINTGKKASTKTKEKHRERMLGNRFGVGRLVSEETKRKMKISHIELPGREIIDSEGVRYFSMADAARQNNVPISSMKLWIKVGKKVNGKIFRKVDSTE